MLFSVTIYKQHLINFYLESYINCWYSENCCPIPVKNSPIAGDDRIPKTETGVSSSEVKCHFHFPVFFATSPWRSTSCANVSAMSFIFFKLKLSDCEKAVNGYLGWSSLVFGSAVGKTFSNVQLIQLIRMYN